VSDVQASRPRLPSATEAIHRVLDPIDRWQRAGGEAPAIWLHGPPGAGKTTILHALRRELAQRSFAPLLASPPELDLDAPLHLTVQLASDMRSHGANGALDVVVDPEADDGAKEEALLAELRKLDRGVLLLNVPFSWSARPHDSGERFAVRERGDALLSSLLVLATEQRIPFVLATRGHWRWPEDLPWPRRIKVRPESEGAVLLRDAASWGALARSAECLDSLIGRRAEEMSPLELRVAVALLALSYSDSDVRAACFGGLHALLRLLAEEAEHRGTLRAALSVLARVRFPLDAKLVGELLATHLPGGAGSAWEQQVIEDALLFEQEGGVVLHPSIRSVHDFGADDEATDDVQVHAWLADVLASSTAEAPILASREHAIRKLERLYQAARGLQRDVILDQAFDNHQICTLARAYSLAGKKQEALGLYETVLTRNPRHRYARAYVAYHLEQLGKAPLRAETLFKDSRDDEPTNPWWARRYICCLIRRGRLAGAREEWLKALGKLSDDEGEDDREEWLARNFHLGIARQFLSRGAIEPAREVLMQVPARMRSRNAELAEIWNQLLHMEESERLGGAVFPLFVPFPERWNGPHIDELRTDGKSLDAWYPGRIVTLGERVVLQLAEPPLDGTETRLFRSVMTREAFLECTRRRSLELVSEGQFFEAVVAGDDTRIELHPVRRRGLRVSVGFLRYLEEPE